VPELPREALVEWQVYAGTSAMHRQQGELFLYLSLSSVMQLKYILDTMEEKFIFNIIYMTQ